MKMCQCIISSYQWICLSKGQWAIFLIWTTLHCGVILCHFLKHFPYIFSFIFWTPLNLPGMPALKNQHVCVGRKLERPFIRLSRLNQMNSRVMFRRWWGILWAFYPSICCERINLQRKLHDKLKTCAVCYPFTTRDCSQFGTGERQSKGYLCHTCSRKCARPVATYGLHKSKENPKNYFCNPDMWNCVSACEVCNFLAYEKSQCPKVTCLCSDL